MNRLTCSAVILAVCQSTLLILPTAASKQQPNKHNTKTTTQVSDDLSEVKRLIAAGEIESAKSILNSIKSTKKNETERWCLVSEIYLAQANFDQAMDAAEKAYALNPSSSHAIKLYAETACCNSRFTLAERLCRQLGSIQNHDVEATMLMSRIYKMSYRYDQAIVEINKLIRRFPDNTDYRESRAELLMHRRKWKQALVDLSAVENTKHPQTNIRIYRQMAKCHLYTKQYDRSVDYASRVLKKFPHDALALQIRAQSYEHLGRRDLAKRDREIGKLVVDDTDVTSGN